MEGVKRKDISSMSVVGALLSVDFVQRAVWLETDQGPSRFTSRKALKLEAVKQGDLASVRLHKDGSLSVRKWNRSAKSSGLSVQAQEK